MFLAVMEYIVLTLFLILVITQLIIPFYKGRHLFPWFRKKPEKELEDKLMEATEKKDEADLKETVKDIRQAKKSTVYNRQRQRNRKWKIPEK